MNKIKVLVIFNIIEYWLLHYNNSFLTFELRMMSFHVRFSVHKAKEYELPMH
jgi:hypothetical protein